MNEHETRFIPGAYDGPDPGVLTYQIGVFIRPDDNGHAIVSILGSPAEGWNLIDENAHPTLARAVAHNVTLYAQRLASEADLVDDVDTLDADAIITNHRTRDNT